MKKTAEECSVKYFEGDELAAKVFLSKYAGEDEKTPDNMHQRLAYNIAVIERKYQKELTNKKINIDKLSDLGRNYVRDLCESNDYQIRDKWFQLFKNFKYIVPGGSIMASLGKSNNVSLANCFGIEGPKDKMESIMDKGKEMAYLFMRRGGVGTHLDHLRPNGAMVNNASKTSTGAPSFMELYSTDVKTIGQNGRRGALMLCMSDIHPDISEFVTIKQDLTKVTGANISVKLCRNLVTAAQKNEDWLLKWPINSRLGEFINWNSKDFEYNKLYYAGKSYFKKVKANELLDLIIDCAWKTAEPGILLWDNIINYDPASVYPRLKAVTTNPCGEQPLGDADSCRLSHINLLSFVKNPFTNEASFDYELFRKIAYEHVIFLDDIIDLECKNIENIINHSDAKSEIELWKRVLDAARKGRRIGCGFTALGDTIAAMNLSFKDSHYLVESIMETKFKAELEASIDLAYLRGTFLDYDYNLEYPEDKPSNQWYEFLINNYPKLVSRMKELGRRNVSLSTVAPVGSGSLLTQTTSGIEPVFKTLYDRRVKVNAFDEKYDFIDPNTKEKFKVFTVAHKGFQKFCEITTGKKFNELSKSMTNTLFKSSPYYNNEAADIPWQTRLEIQAIVQKYTTSSISTTINLASDVSKDVVKQIYLNAYKMGLKGVTVYRDGSRSGVLVSTDNKTKDPSRKAPKRPSELLSHIHNMKVQGKNYLCALGFYEGKPYEIFVCPTPEDIKLPDIGKIVKIKKGYYQLQDQEGKVIIENFVDVMDDQLEMITRILSISIRSDVGFNFLIDQLKKSKGELTAFHKVLARTIAKYVDNNAKSGENCPMCGDKLVFNNGCLLCKSCSFSKCS